MTCAAPPDSTLTKCRRPQHRAEEQADIGGQKAWIGGVDQGIDHEYNSQQGKTTTRKYSRMNTTQSDL
jgi:hypothetical protein